jgi:predicted dehydrogenase
VPNRISRRRFVQGTLAATAAAGILGSRPRLLRAANGSPNGRLRLACIGTANQASSDFDQIVASGKVQVMAMCDVDDSFLDKALMKEAAEGAKRFNDYRKMFDTMADQFDAVLVAIPDHQHFPAAMWALNHGKHLYCEKPLCHDVWEVRKLTETAREKKLVTQMGTQIHGMDNYRRVVEKIRAGAIGKVKRAHSWVEGTYVAKEPNKTAPVPSYLHWDLWIGPSAEHEYNPELHPFWWRDYLAYGGGKLADMACHHMDLPTWALGLTAPTTIESHGPDPDPVSGPAWQVVDYHYPAVGDRDPVHLTWYHGSENGKAKRPPQFYDPSLKMPKWGDGSLFEGENGKMLLASYGNHVLLPEVDFKDYRDPEQTIPNAKRGHYYEWVQACLDNKPENCLCRFDYSGPLTEAVQLGVVSHRVGNQKLEWEPANARVTNVADAAKFMKREYRKGWEI